MNMAMQSQQGLVTFNRVAHCQRAGGAHKDRASLNHRVQMFIDDRRYIKRGTDGRDMQIKHRAGGILELAGELFKVALQILLGHFSWRLPGGWICETAGEHLEAL